MSLQPIVRLLRAPAPAVAVLLCAAACGPGSRSAEETLSGFFAAVQAEDLDRLYCSLAGASSADDDGKDEAVRRGDFDAWARSRFEAYLEGRDEGRVDVEGAGITLVKLFALGRGTFFRTGAVRAAGSGAMEVETGVRFAYAHVDLSRFTPGTTFYVCGVPPGRVHGVRVPAGSVEVSLELLETIDVHWTLVNEPATESCPAGWKVVSAELVEGSAVSSEITWVF